MAPTMGLVLNKVFWLINTAKPFGQFLMILFQSSGSEPLPIALNMRPKLNQARPKEARVNIIKIRRSKLESIYFFIEQLQ
jgi:hypothetical protein